MSIDARIASVVKRNEVIVLFLAPYKHSDGVMSIPGAARLGIVNCTQRPVAGQKIWGDAGRCIIEAGNGGERIEYTRRGIRLFEEATNEQPK